MITCGYCLKPLHEPFIIPTTLGYGIAPYCQACHAIMSTQDKIMITLETINGWRARNPNRDLDEIEERALAWIIAN